MAREFEATVSFDPPIGFPQIMSPAGFVEINGGAFYFEATFEDGSTYTGYLDTGTVGCRLEPWGKIHVTEYDLPTEPDQTYLNTTVWSKDVCPRCPFNPEDINSIIKCKVAKRPV